MEDMIRVLSRCVLFRGLSEEEIAEIEWRFESLKPYLKPGKFDG